jgi:hypothetical protein
MAKKKKAEVALNPPKTAEQKWAELEAKLSLPQYQNQKYSDNSKVEISGQLFADFVNTQQNNTRLLIQMLANVEATKLSIEGMLNTNDRITIELMEQHVRNIDAGATETVQPEKLDVLKIARDEE